MDIWKTLGIAPTTDKRSIRRAYAAKTRELHPEEKPEEFRQLHDAYQEALGYAEFMSKIDWSEDVGPAWEQEPDREEQADQTSEQDPEPESEEPETATALLSYFAENQEKHQQSVDAFIKYWKEFQSPYRNPEVLDWWKEYLTSEEFQDIRYHAQVLHLLAEEINDKFFYGLNEVKLLFWDAYGFQDDEEDTLQGDQQRLYKSLYPAFEKQQRILQNAHEVARNEKIIRVFAGVAAVVIIVACIFAFVTYRRRKEEGLQYLVDYMAQEYAETSFSEPEYKTTVHDGSFVYMLHSEAHPELEITAQVRDRYVNGVRIYEVEENYERLLFEYYAPQYGLEAGQYGYGEAYYTFLLYRDIGQIDEFCENVERMFEEQEELQGVYETAVYTQEVLFPDVLLAGGVEHYSFMEPQVYDLRAMEAQELAAALKEAYMIYMFQCESWNITPAQYREWGAAYEKICERWVSDDGEWCEVYDPETGECLCRVFVNTYEYIDGSYNAGGISVPRYKRAITVGNAFYYLLDRGANLEIGPSGNYFGARLFGETTTFG
ncbi:MAG: J domain-containing protein, partial [Lachnospiraceae bacterium]|nr:J domain-containing protein [Lachnospiraceae bacterium]